MISNHTFLNVQESVFKIAKGAGAEVTVENHEIVKIPLAALKLMSEILLELVLLLLIGLGFLLLHFMTCVLFVGMVISIVSGRSPRIVFRGLASTIRASLARRRCSSNTRVAERTRETLINSGHGIDSNYYGSVLNVV